LLEFIKLTKKMFGCIEPCIIYGFGEGKYNRGIVIDWNWLDDHYPYVQPYADGLVRNIPGEAFYGIQCSTWNKINKKEKKVVDIFCKYINLYRKSKNKFEEELVPNFHLVITGDINWDNVWQEKYYPEADMELSGYDDISDEEDESDNEDESDRNNKLALEREGYQLALESLAILDSNESTSGIIPLEDSLESSNL